VHRARCASKNSFALPAHRARRPRPSRRSHASRTPTRPAIAIQGSRGRDTSASSVDACDSARRDPARDRRARPPRARAFRIVFTSHAPLDRLGRLEGGNLAEHGGGGDGRHGDRLVTFLERTNGARRGRGREKERFVRVVDLSFKHACLVFFSISMYYVLQYEHIIHGSEFRTCGADRNARVTGSSTPGSAIEGGFTTGRIDRSMDG